MQINKDITRILNEFTIPLKNIKKVHYKNYRYLLPNSVNKFPISNKYKKNNISYDLYGWSNDALIDVYPTYNNILAKEDLPIKWTKYIHDVCEATKITKFSILIYDMKNKKFSNVLHYTNDPIYKIKSNHNVTDNWIKASGIKNYIMDDTILDVMNKKRKLLSNENYSNLNQESDVLERMTMGNEYERDIIDQIIQKYYLYFTKIAESYQARDIEKYKKTISAMKNGIPIIHQAVLHYPEKKLFGCVDLLIRADWIEKMFNMIYPHYYTSCNKTNNCHYVIVDIKFHRLQLNVDNITVRNEGMINVFKSQLCIYNTILGYMQGYLPKSAYILGRGWKQQRIKNGELIVEKNNDPFDKLGVIDFLVKDSNIVIKTEEGCNWLHELNTNINNFNEITPKYNHSYPNMKNQNDQPFKKRKLDIAEDRNELTLIGYVGAKNRMIGISNNINSYLDEKISANKLGFTGKTEQLVNVLLDNQKLTVPIKGKYKVPEQAKNIVEIFLDFEYMYSFDEDENIPYLCGIGYIDNKEEWKFNYVLLKDISLKSRKNMCENIIQIINKIKDTNICRIFTWSNVDKKILMNIVKKFNLENTISNIEWVDAYKFCVVNKINFKGARRYGLKEIGRILCKNNLTNLSWENNLIGSSSGVRQYYYNNKKWDSTNVIKYNEIDCKMVYEVIRNLRKYQI